MESNQSKNSETACSHFGICGGCSLQHLNHAEYTEFKNNILAGIIRRLGVDESCINPLIEIGKYNRRRAEFKVSVNKGTVSIGFFKPKSHEVVDIKTCPIIKNEIMDAIPAIKTCITSLKKAGNINAINITLLQNGLDIVIKTKKAILKTDEEKFVEIAKQNNIIRLSEQIDESDNVRSFYLNASKNPYISFDDITVLLPAGAFLQATKKGQIAISKLVLENTKKCKRVADLFSGCGTYSFALAKQVDRVSAYEIGHEMMTAMFNSIRQNNLETRLTPHERDLFKQPLLAWELNKFDAIVINPPRKGADAQTKEIVKSNVKKVVMVSCNSYTFERDAKTLLKQGFSITQATPIDQFYWSNLLEIVAVFER